MTTREALNQIQLAIHSLANVGILPLHLQDAELAEDQTPDDVGVDSIGQAALISELEVQLDIPLTVEAVSGIDSFGRLAELITTSVGTGSFDIATKHQERFDTHPDGATGIVTMIEELHERVTNEIDLPQVSTVESNSASTEISIDGKTYLNMSVNGYLGVGEHPKVTAAIEEGLEVYGSGANAVRWTGGNLDPHTLLEQAVARFMDPSGAKEAITFSNGYLTNVGVIPALVSPTLLPRSVNSSSLSRWGDAAIFSDTLNHQSLVDGCQLAQVRGRGSVQLQQYRHCDMKHLEQLLRRSGARRRLIVTDGVFSLTGQLAPLGDIVELAEAEGAEVYVDDCHGVGMLGEHGRGTAELFGVEDRVHFHMGTFSKGLGAEGGYVVADPAVVQYLRYQATTYIYSTSMPPAIALGLIKILEIVGSDEGRKLRQQLAANTSYLEEGLVSAGFDVNDSQTQILPVQVGDESQAKRISARLKGAGIFAPMYCYPAVPRGRAMIRLNVMATHSREQLDRVLACMVSIGKEEGLI